MTLKTYLCAVVAFLCVLQMTRADAQLLATPPNGAPSANEIFEKAWQTWEQAQDPPFVSFTVPCAQLYLKVCPTANVRVTMRTSDGQLFIQTAPGLDAPARALVRGGRITYAGLSFGFYRSMHKTLAPSSALAPDPFGTPTLPVIASVVSAPMDYHVVLDATRLIDGDNVYELILQPLRNPDEYPLRKLSVDAATFQVRSLTYERTPGNNTLLLTYDFAQVGPQKRWWIARVSWHDTLRILFLNRQASGTMELRNITFPAYVPNSDFEAIPTPTPSS